MEHRVAHLIFGIVLAATISCSSSAKLAAEAFADKNGYFRFAPPAGWTKTDFPADPRSKVQFDTTGASLAIIAYRPLNPAPIDAVKQNQEDQLKVLQERAGARASSAEVVEFAGRTSVESIVEMRGQKLWTLHFFLPKDVFVTVTLSADSQTFTRRLLEAKSSLTTLQAGDAEGTDPEIVRAQAIARLLHKSKIEIELGRHREAEAAYKQVLEMDPDNKTARAGLEGLPRAGSQ